MITPVLKDLEFHYWWQWKRVTIAFISIPFDLPNYLGIFSINFSIRQQSVDSDGPFALSSPTPDGPNNQSLKRCYIRIKTMDKIKEMEKIFIIFTIYYQLMHN